MISAVYLINLKGEILIYRAYRDDVSRAAADAFRMQVGCRWRVRGRACRRGLQPRDPMWHSWARSSRPASSWLAARSGDDSSCE